MIPNVVLIAGAIAAVGDRRRDDPSSLAERAIAAVGAGGFLLRSRPSPTRGGMGMGDVKLAAVMGLFLGAPWSPALRRRGRRRRPGRDRGPDPARAPARASSAIPFGPFLALGGVVGLLAGDEMLDWYLDSFVR